MINIAELLKNASKDLELYSPICGHCKLSCILHDDGIRVIAHDVPFRFDKYGRFCSADDAECLLFPSKDCRTWEGWKTHKPHYDIANFKPKQWVLVRDDDEWEWALTRFSYLSNGSTSLFVCINGASFQQCIPFDGNEKLLGTTDMCDGQYINW